MKLTIELPKFRSAYFANPSAELLAFTQGFIAVCTEITERYRKVTGEMLFFAYVRNGATTVFCTDSKRTKKIAVGRRQSKYDDESNVFAFFSPDDPGDWTVAELFIDGWGSSLDYGNLTLRSSDFIPYSGQHEPKIQIFMNRVIQHLTSRMHTVPNFIPRIGQ